MGSLQNEAIGKITQFFDDPLFSHIRYKLKVDKVY